MQDTSALNSNELMIVARGSRLGLVKAHGGTEHHGGDRVRQMAAPVAKYCFYFRWTPAARAKRVTASNSKTMDGH